MIHDAIIFSFEDHDCRWDVSILRKMSVSCAIRGIAYCISRNAALHQREFNLVNMQALLIFKPGPLERIHLVHRL